MRERGRLECKIFSFSAGSHINSNIKSDINSDTVTSSTDHQEHDIVSPTPTCTGLIPSPMSSVLGSLALNACISPRIAVPVNPARIAKASRSCNIGDIEKERGQHS
jgi:hypothetical protein